MVRCTRCDLFLSRTQVVPGSGNLRARVLFVGEAPGAAEDREGVPFVGRSGALLTEMLAGAGIPREEVFIANVIRCRPPANRPPRPAEVRACAGWLVEQIRLLNPALIVTLGRFAYQHFVPKGSITLAQAQVAEVETTAGTVRLYPLLHPSAILRDPRKRSLYAEQFRNIHKILSELGSAAYHEGAEK
jgi:DNA polymerase